MYEKNLDFTFLKLNITYLVIKRVILLSNNVKVDRELERIWGRKGYLAAVLMDVLKDFIIITRELHAHVAVYSLKLLINYLIEIKRTKVNILYHKRQ